MVKFPEVSERLFRNVYVCKRCKTKMKSLPQKILEKRVKCRGCGGKSFRALRKLVKAAAGA